MLSWRSIREALTPARTRIIPPRDQEPSEPRDLPHLPQELLLHIIQLAVPSAFPDDSLSDRLSSLRSFSLVSRSWRDTAQLELFQSAVLYDTRALRGFLGALAGHRELSALVKVLFLGKGRRRWFLEWEAEAREIVKLCTNLEQLSLGSVRGICFAELVPCSNLLALSAINSSFAAPPSSAPLDVSIGTPPSSAAFPPSAHSSPSAVALTPSRLRHLDLGRCTLPLGSIPSAQAFPSLRALALWLTSEEVEASTESISQLFHQIEGQLCALTISGSLHLLLSPSLRRMSALKLVDVWEFSSLDVLDALDHPLQLLHINMAGRRTSTHPNRTPLAISTLQQRLGRPRVEIALNSLQEVRISFEKPPTAVPQFAELEAVCKMRNIRLEYDLRPSLGFHFESEYWRAVRESEKGWEWDEGGWC